MVLLLDPDPHGKVGILRAPCKPIAFLMAVFDFRVRAQKLINGPYCIAVAFINLTDAPVIELAPRMANKLPLNLVRHLEASIAGGATVRSGRSLVLLDNNRHNHIAPAPISGMEALDPLQLDSEPMVDAVHYCFIHPVEFIGKDTDG
jgi:hypothetical protein